ncbi:endonuclease domain-containing 1 protein [Megalobrama amblycephala]|uniref:endonuclease domain-containing 1 protein n=1 Tax=Megalobrama amblycephala TaxID=75352 RepID=UPI002013C452|nr:endonuclease domain-containing 1 protein [Megalobrama amblycephala]
MRAVFLFNVMDHRTVFQVFLYFLLVTVRSEVQKDFSEECREFMYMGTPPRGLENRSLKKICQRYNGKPRYVTLYDVVDHIPVYSAYTFKRSDGFKKVDVPWMYEPQLSTTADSGEMQPFPQNVHGSFSDTQAILEDYSDTVEFERGHLNPDEHQAHPDDKAATYTLTNVVPQVREFNIGHWKRHEHIIRRRLNNYCRGTAYIVTGVTTSGRMIRRYNIDRVAVPTYLWSAYCCVDYDRNAPFDERSKFPAFASHGLNEKEGAEVIEMSVQQLEDFLKRNTFVDKRFQIFFENCEPNNVIMKGQT